MTSFLRTISFIALGLGALALLILVAANIYLQTTTVQDRIRQATTASMGYPVEISRVFFTPWSGLTLGNLKATDPASPETVVFQAHALNVRFAWLPLLSRQFVITSISLRDPILNLAQNQEFAVLPPTERIEVVLPDDPADIEIKARPLPGDQPETAGPGLEPVPSGTPSAPFFTVEVRSFHFIDGHIILRDEKGYPAVELRKFNLQTELGPEFSMKGLARVEELILGGALHLRKIEAPFLRQKGQITIEALRAILAEGRLQGSAVIQESTQDFQAAVALEGALIATLMKEASVAHGRAQGELDAIAEFTGGSDPATWRGQGSLVLREATLEPLDFLRQVGQLLRISELQLLRLAEARADFILRGQTLELSNLHLASDNLLIRSSGTIDLEAAELDLKARLMFNEEIQRNLGGLLSGFLSPSEEPGYREVPFRVYGPASSPRTDLLDRVGGGTVGREVGRFLQGLFGSPPSPKDEE